MITFKGKYTEANVMAHTLDAETSQQIHTFINNKHFKNPIALMPDLHAGKGAVIGFTMLLGDVVVPNVVGVDQSCGMYAVRLEKSVKDTLVSMDKDAFDRKVRDTVPMSNKVHKKPRIEMEKFPWDEVNKKLSSFTERFNRRYSSPYKPFNWTPKLFDLYCYGVKCAPLYAQLSLGTLGGGNHFIEVGIDEEDHPWLVVHTGSRNLGLKVANHYQKIAVTEMEKKAKEEDFEKRVEKIKTELPKSEWDVAIKQLQALPKCPKELAGLNGVEMFRYLESAVFLNVYASVNRQLISSAVLEAMGPTIPGKIIHTIETVHNYISSDDFIIRKGAVSARQGEEFVLPFNMEDGILICRGKGNADWNCSGPHGAGRLFSRSKAKEKLDVAKARTSMESKGIFSKVLPADELKGAYKSASVIEEAIEPTADIIHRIKPLINFKAK